MKTKPVHNLFSIKRQSILLPMLLWVAFSPAQDVRGLQRNVRMAQSDTAAISAMLALGQWHLDRIGKKSYPKSRDSVWYYTKKSERLSNSGNYDVSLAKSYIFTSKIYFEEVNYTEASAFAKKAVSIAESTNDKKTLCEAYSAQLTADLQTVPLPEGSYQLSQKTLQLCRESGEKFLEAWTIENIAYYYLRTKDHKKTIDYLESAIAKYIDLRRYKEMKYAYSSLSNAYGGMSNTEKSFSSTLKALDILNQSDEYFLVDYYTYSSAARIYTEMQDPKTAVFYAQKAFSIASQYDNLDNLSIAESVLVDCLHRAKRYKEIKPHLQRMDSYLHSLIPVSRANILATLLQFSMRYNDRKKADRYAAMLLKLAQDKDLANILYERFHITMMWYYYYIGDDGKSRAYAQNYKTLAIKSGYIAGQSNALEHLYKIDSIQGNYLSALRHYNLANKYKDSVLNIEKNKELARLETMYSTKEKEKDNLLLKKQRELQQTELSETTLEKNLGLIGMAILIITVSLIFRRYYLNQKIRKETTNQNKALEELLNEKEWLLKEIHHRVKNNLQIVMSLLNTQSHFLENESAKTAIKNSQDRIHSMSLIHKKLYQSDNVVSINMELYIKELIEYFKITFDTGQRIRFVLNIEPIELTSSQAVPLGLIINECTINSIKHAFPSSREGCIEISMKEGNNNQIELLIKDDGIGIADITCLKASPSLGVKLIEGFSKELNADLAFDNNNGFAIFLSFKKTTYDNNTLQKVSA